MSAPKTTYQVKTYSNDTSNNCNWMSNLVYPLLAALTGSVLTYCLISYKSKQALAHRKCGKGKCGKGRKLHVKWTRGYHNLSNNVVLPWEYTDASPSTATIIKATSPNPLPPLFTPLKLRGLNFKNRIAVSPMCMYSSADGFLTDWHLVHLGGYAVGGAALIIQEATAVQPNGRISPSDAGIYLDEHVAQMRRIVNFIHSQNSLAGIQLAHAGRKASTAEPFFERPEDKPCVDESKQGWPKDVVGPSALSYGPGWLIPRELSLTEIAELKKAWIKATYRVIRAGFDYLEIHAAHGYLFTNFLSELSNKRTDQYGGSFENRIRLLLEITTEIREIWPQDRPLSVRLTCKEWVEGGWDIPDTIKLVRELIALGVDQIDCSSGGNVHNQKINVGLGYQIPFSEAIKKEFGSKVSTAGVGLIINAKQANDIIANGQADIVLLAREFLRNPRFPFHAAQELGVDLHWPPQYKRAKRRL